MCSPRGYIKPKEICFNCGNVASLQYTYLSKNKRRLLGLLPLRLYVFTCDKCGLKYITCSSGAGFRVIDRMGMIIKNHPSVSYGYKAIEALIEKGEIFSQTVVMGMV
jgi:hypothetical protein